MNSFNKATLYIGILLIIILGGCTDDFDYRTNSNSRPGDANIAATISFIPYSSSSPTRATVAPPGDGMREITDFAILIYDLQGNLLSKHGASSSSNDTGDFTDLVFSTVERTDNDALPGNTTTEPETGQATFNWKFNQWGEFYIYVAANMGRWTGETRTSSTIEELESKYSEAIKTMEGLKSIQLTWDASNYRNNRQMLGFFTTDNAHHSDATVVKINKPSLSLHAWLKRAASKVTIDFDGSGLRENVMIYLKQAVIRNIPKSCYLGKTNTPKDTTETLYATETWRLTESKNEYGHHLDYFPEGSENNYQNWPMVAKSSPKLKHPDASHDDEAKALFFYENCQGNFADDPDKDKYDKRQYPAEDGTVADYADMRDNVPAGTYIEVEGWYQNNNASDAGNGRIIYRFMLGKDIKYDFNAERNTHYKVTLKFKGNGNDFDWHIDYREEDGFAAPNPYFISYLYDEGMVLPLRYKGDLTDKKIKAEIIENDWYPKDAKGKGVYYEGTVTDDGVWNGFLSLKKTTHADIGNNEAANSGYNQQYWEGNGKQTDDINEKVSPRGNRIYEATPQAEPYGDSTDGYYSVDYDEAKESTVIGIPLYTRAKTLVSRTGFTGNNPYSAYRRYAKVRFTVVDNNGVEIGGAGNKIEIEIIQVTRVVNPKAIYRSNDCDNPFKVVLTKLTDEDDETFTKIESIGPWSAKIEYGKEWFKISGNGSGINNITSDSIRGGSGSVIEFDYTPNGKNSGTPRCGIILVRYHNETCIHRIFVRQGYDPIQVTDNGPYIHSFNLVTKDTETDNPLDEGSLFRYGTEALDYPIDACNNVADGFLDHTNDALTIAGKSEKTEWSKIPSVAYSGYKYPEFQLANGGKGRLLLGADIAAMKSKEEIGYGFGVVYGDESITTALDVEDAYEYRKSGKTSGRGIRCLVLYNKKDGRNIVFPIGASGYGRRRYGKYYADTNKTLLYTKEFKNFIFGETEFRSGVVRYAHRTLPMDQDPDGNTNYRPLFWDLYRRPGGNYWLNEYYGAQGVFDINYFTFDTSCGDSNHCNVSPYTNESDACFLRLVENP